MSEWIAHVKQFQAQHGCSYKDALKGASSSYRSMKGNGVNRLKKAQRWEGFADSTLHDAIDTANKARKTYQKGMGVNRLKKAQRWEGFADSTLHDAIDTANKARKTFQKGMGVTKKQAIASLQMANAMYGDQAMSQLKKHRKKLSGMALYAAGY
jgi:benzoyl-CoA reductase/2-hydroxyglutaryl-CoA dehydratase subunit BcrC/BadD/HgdB